MKRYLDQKLKFRYLRAIAAIEQQQSLLRAADVLGISQPALTKSLKEVEDILGTRIFDRHARGLTANRFGKVAADTARRILGELRAMEDAFDRIDDDASGTVVVGALPTAAAGIMPGVVKHMQKTDPEIEIRVVDGRTDDLLTALALGDIDLIVGRLYLGSPSDGLVREALYDEPFAIIAGAHHPLARNGPIQPSALSAYELSLPIATLRIHEDTREFMDQFGIAASTGISTTSLSLMRELLLTSDLLTLMPPLMLMGDIVRGGLKTIPLVGQDNAPPRPAGLIYRADRPLLPPAQRFAQAVSAYANSLASTPVGCAE
jgi:LysR family transcriptional regulator, pca operon transcriptional activator